MKRWTDNQRREFETQCSQLDTFKNLVVLFKGYGNNEFDSVQVEEYNNGKLSSTFKIHVDQSQGSVNDTTDVRSATIKRTLNKHFQYKFILPRQQQFMLTNMKMTVWPQWTIKSEGYGCVMGSYAINGEKFESSANPMLIKPSQNKE